MNPKLKIGLIVALVVAVIVAVYYLLKKPSIASSEAKQKAKSGTYGTWADGSPDWGAYVAKSLALFGQGGNKLYREGGDNQAYASGFLKGINVSRSAASLEAFATDIRAYIANTSARKPDEAVTPGEYL